MSSLGKGKYAGGIGKDNFRRPLRPDARGSAPIYWQKYMKHDWYWGIGKPLLYGAVIYTVFDVFSRSHMEHLYDTTAEELASNNRLLQVHGDDILYSKTTLMSRALAKAQIRAYISGDPVWEEAVHRDFFDNQWWYFYHVSQGIDPAECEYLPLPIQYRPKNNKFDFHEEKTARREQEIKERGTLSMTEQDRKVWLAKLQITTRDCVNSNGILGGNAHSLDFVRTKKEYCELLHREIVEKNEEKE